MNSRKILSELKGAVLRLCSLEIQWCKSLNQAKNGALVLFPLSTATLHCGLSALVAYKHKDTAENSLDMDSLFVLLSMARESSFCIHPDETVSLPDNYLGGEETLDRLFKRARELKTRQPFFEIFTQKTNREKLNTIAAAIEELIQTEKQQLNQRMVELAAHDVDIAFHRMDKLQDTGWCIKKEVLENIHRIRELSSIHSTDHTRVTLELFKKINAVLNSMDRLEVRGRDSAGISLLFVFSKSVFEQLDNDLKKRGLEIQLKQRTNRVVLTNNSITVFERSTPGGEPVVSLSFVYKFAAEIGALGDNVAFLRNQIRNDQILQLASESLSLFNTVCAHTRWASVGDITEANCHPVDNQPTDKQIKKSGIIQVSLNGDIDNYLELKGDYESRYDAIHPEITTDTKIIPLQIEHHLRQGLTIEEAFRKALNDFQGSHAISMHTDLAPGKLFLAQKGSGQALFIGIAQDHYIAASELYGLVEETRHFIKLNGEKNGQIMILDQNSPGGIAGLRSMAYDGSPIELSEADIQTSDITSRDIDRQNYPHYFLKEISEAPLSVEKTLQNKWKKSPETGLFKTVLDPSVITDFLEADLKAGRIRKIYFIGQGTAGIAAQGCANLLISYLSGSDIDIRAMKSSELSGFSIKGGEEETHSMGDTLVVAISQSGTTTDTNRTVDMVKIRGARTLAIVNRRDSDLTFKSDGVLYTSSGRDIEMSVASTKAFYSQITAGAILGLHLATLLGTISPDRVTQEIRELSTLPEKMQKVLNMKEEIGASARRLSVSKNYWATVGSGANKTSADEIRIKLSELCYKTISSDYVEDKKHIDLSSEPLIIICAAGTRESVLSDIIKDTAIFHAHKATPVVITDEDEDRFDPYSKDIFRIPRVKEHLAPILNTLVGHLWGYYAALAINEGSQFIYLARTQIQELIDEYTSMGHDIYEIILEKRFREKIAQFYNSFSKKRREKKFPAAIGLDNATNITLLLKYLSGRLPVSDFEIDFAKKGTPSNMLNTFFETLGESINIMARPVDAIKHQAKTVTVGTSRITEQFKGLVFDELAAHRIAISQLLNKNVVVIKNLQEVVGRINGGLLYRISGLTLLGEPGPDTKIEVIKKTGRLKGEFSRVEKDHTLKGTKHIIVREGNVYIGKGRMDGRSILVIPILSSSPATPNAIEFILSLNVGFKTPQEVSLLKRIKALGGKYTRIKDTVFETGKNITWDDKFLDLVPLETLFGDSFEKIADYIISRRQP